MCAMCAPENDCMYSAQVAYCIHLVAIHNACQNQCLAIDASITVKVSGGPARCLQRSFLVMQMPVVGPVIHPHLVLAGKGKSWLCT